MLEIPQRCDVARVYDLRDGVRVVDAASPGALEFVDPLWSSIHIVGAYLPEVRQTLWLNRLIIDEAATLIRAAIVQLPSQLARGVQGFVPRRKRWDSAGAVSMHTWGLALDLTPVSGSMAEYPHARTVFTAAGWSWGGPSDPNHFERVRG